MKKQLLFLFALSLLFVGCVVNEAAMMTIAMKLQAIPTPIDSSSISLYHSNKTLKVNYFFGSGGVEYSLNPFTPKPTMIERGLKYNLLVTLKNTEIFTIVDANQISNYSLNVILLSQELQDDIIDMTSALIVRYYLIDEATLQEIWSKDIRSVYTVKSDDSFFRERRIEMANGGVVNENIKILINELSSLRL
ncbi:MAG: hypothetical protein H8E98_00100 [Bacteroidetes bacterium]|nr:hypothetical protein [Bacteroidota bacterium]